MKRNVVITGALITLIGGVLLLWGAYHYFSYINYSFGTALVFSGMGTSFVGIAIALFGLALDGAELEQSSARYTCPKCGYCLEWVAPEQKYYCSSCREYV